jgi:hypothetical protein
MKSTYDAPERADFVLSPEESAEAIARLYSNWFKHNLMNGFRKWSTAPTEERANLVRDELEKDLDVVSRHATQYILVKRDPAGENAESEGQSIQ